MRSPQPVARSGIEEKSRRRGRLGRTDYSTSNFPNSRRILYGIALAVFGALGGTGVAWILIGTFANFMSKTQGNSFIADSIPKLVAGGTIGFAAGIIIAAFFLRAASASALASWEEKFIGRRGALKIYGGVPMFLLALLFPAFEPLARAVGNTAAPCIILALFLVFVGLSLFLYDRIPPRLIIPFGLLGWMLTFALACLYYWFGPGAFGHRHP